MSKKWITTTDWALIARAGDVDVEVKRQALAELLRRYLPALKLHLTHSRRLHGDQADDVVQGFLVSKVIEQDLIRRADREKGRFRNFLLTALDRFAVDWLREQNKHRGHAVDLDEQPEQAVAAAPGSTFDVAWAEHVLDETLRRMRAECEGLSHRRIWQVFEKRILAPAQEQAVPPSYEQLVRDLKFDSPSQASNALVTAKRMYQRILRTVIGEYELGEADVEAEIADLYHILGQRRA